MASIQDAINQAQDAAAQMAATENAAQENTPAVIEGHVSPGGTVTTYQAPSLSTFSAQKGLLPRNTLYLKPTEFGFRIGKNKDMVQEFVAEIDLTEGEGIQPKWTVRFGNPAQYLSSYDGVTCNKGGAWTDAVLKARMANPDVEPYPAAEVKLVLAEDLKLKEETLKAGTIIGYDTSSPSRYSDLSDFLEEAQKAGVMGTKVKVKVIAREINHNGNNWGTVAFELMK